MAERKKKYWATFRVIQKQPTWKERFHYFSNPFLGAFHAVSLPTDTQRQKHTARQSLAFTEGWAEFRQSQLSSAALRWKKMRGRKKRLAQNVQVTACTYLAAAQRPRPRVWSLNCKWGTRRAYLSPPRPHCASVEWRFHSKLFVTGHCGLIVTVRLLCTRCPFVRMISLYFHWIWNVSL